MSTKAGTLLWRRMKVTVPSSGVIDVNTGLIQQTKNFPDQSPNEPPLGRTALVSPPPGATPASRIHVIPLAPITQWLGVFHAEPYVSTVTNTIHLAFSDVAAQPQVHNINVMFWDPHSVVGPGHADTYNIAD